MLISELIESFQKVQGIHGDLPVIFQTRDRERHELCSIVHETEYLRVGDPESHYCLDLTFKGRRKPM